MTLKGNFLSSFMWRVRFEGSQSCSLIWLTQWKRIFTIVRHVQQLKAVAALKRFLLSFIMYYLWTINRTIIMHCRDIDLNLGHELMTRCREWVFWDEVCTLILRLASEGLYSFVRSSVKSVEDGVSHWYAGCQQTSYGENVQGTDELSNVRLNPCEVSCAAGVE